MECQPGIRWTLYIIVAFIGVFMSLSKVGPFQSSHKNLFSDFNNEPHYKYSIMFDGGSTGTRMHVFTFVNNSNGLLTLNDEYFMEEKPGLSYFAHEPQIAASRVAKLLEKAKELVPSSKWKETPVALKATAGLRLLPTNVSDSILKEVSRVFKNSPFICDDNSVSVLDGIDEGLYAWYTMNFLLGRLDQPNNSVVSLDLGGGSTQVTFLPVDFNTFVFSPKEYIINTKVQNKTLALYSHSYLGLGLMTARLGILGLGEMVEASQSKDSLTTFFTSCVPPNTKNIWDWDQNSYAVISSTAEKYGFETCYDKATHFLEDLIYKPAELQKREIYVLSYYFDRAVDLGIVGKHGGLSSVGEFLDACKRMCSRKTLDQWFLCLDCSYISAIFSYSFEFERSKKIMFVDDIQGKETSWALGAAISLEF